MKGKRKFKKCSHCGVEIAPTPYFKNDDGNRECSECGHVWVKILREGSEDEEADNDLNRKDGIYPNAYDEQAEEEKWVKDLKEILNDDKQNIVLDLRLIDFIKQQKAESYQQGYDACVKKKEEYMEIKVKPVVLKEAEQAGAKKLTESKEYKLLQEKAWKYDELNK